MKKVFEWVKGMAMVAVALLIFLGEGLFWRAWDGAKTVVRLARGGVVLAAKTALVVAVIVVLGFSAIPISKAIGGDNFASSAAKWIEGAMYTYKAYRDAGERNEDSTTGTDYLSVSEECKTSAIIDLSTDASTTVYNGPAILNWAYLSVTIGTEAATLNDNATAKLNLPVSMAVGVHPFTGARFDTSLVVNPGTNSTGTLTLCYRPLDSSQVTY